MTEREREREREGGGGRGGEANIEQLKNSAKFKALYYH